MARFVRSSKTSPGGCICSWVATGVLVAGGAGMIGVVADVYTIYILTAHYILYYACIL